MIPGILGRKISMSQDWSKSGHRLPVTVIQAGPCPVVQVKIKDKDGYSAVQLAFGRKSPRKMSQALKKHLGKAKITTWPRYLREIRLDKDTDLKLGDLIQVASLFQIGDRVQVTGTSKGTGFTGVMKRWGFKGGPKTHGQSDRQRHPGSIGMRAIPGRVWKGKHMAGHAGNATITVKNLEIVAIDAEKNLLKVNGPVPGSRNGLLKIILISKKNPTKEN